MRYFIFSIVCLVIFGQCTKENDVETDDHGNSYYGAKITQEGAISVRIMEQMMRGIERDKKFKLKGKIAQTCAKKGCWMTLEMDNGEEMMVRFKDYAFYVPKEGVQGKNVILEGKAFYENVPVRRLRHYAEDAGKSKEEIEAIKEPKKELAFEAEGLIILN